MKINGQDLEVSVEVSGCGVGDLPRVWLEVSFGNFSARGCGDTLNEAWQNLCGGMGAVAQLWTHEAMEAVQDGLRAGFEALRVNKAKR